MRHHEALDALSILDNAIAARCDAILAEHAHWPCRRGCDHCCRNLAREPEITAAEWARLAPLVRGMQLASDDPRVCPLLDRGTGACRVYEARPVACRTYGFYVERDQGLYCSLIRESVERGEFDGVVWGNAAAVERELQALGPGRPLREWLRESAERQSQFGTPQKQGH